MPLPNADIDYMKLTSKFLVNQYNWAQDPELRAWLLDNRLDGFSRTVAAVPDDDVAKKAILNKLRDNAVPAVVKLEAFIAEHEAATASITQQV